MRVSVGVGSSRSGGEGDAGFGEGADHGECRGGEGARGRVGDLVVGWERSVLRVAEVLRGESEGEMRHLLAGKDIVSE